MHFQHSFLLHQHVTTDAYEIPSMAGKCSRLCYRAPAVTGTPGTKEAEVQASGNFMGGSDTPATMKWYEDGVSLANRALSRFILEVKLK